MPLLPLPPGGTSISGGDIPVSSDDDVLAEYPYALRSKSDPTPVRDAIVSLIAATFLAYQDAAAYAAAQSDPLRATDLYLDGLLSDHGFERQAGESDSNYLARFLAGLAVVTPAAILGAVNSLTGPLTTSKAQYFEAALDRMFLSDGTATWHSFVGVTPQYQDRLYHDDLGVNGVERLQSDPGTNYLFSDAYGRYFVLRVPDLAPIDQFIQMVYNGQKLDPSDSAVPELGGGQPSYTPPLGPGELPNSLGGVGLYLADGSNTSGAEADGSVATFLVTSTTDSVATYATIANTVERIRGQSIRWAMIVDSTL